MTRRTTAWILALFFLSGATSLVYEILWLRQLILIFGSTLLATSTILSTFFAGLALGAFVGGRWLDRRTAHPLRIYAWLEIGIGLYALCVPFLFRGLSPVYQALWDAGGSGSFIGFSLTKFVGIAVVLLPPTMMMGASLPTLARFVTDSPDHVGAQTGSLFAVNTFGAVLGTFVAGFLAIPALGVQRTLWVTALVNGVIGVVALLLARREPRFAKPVAEAPSQAAPSRPAGPAVLLAFGVSGFVALGLEVAWTRILTLIMGGSVYAFALMLLAFLIGLAAGAAATSRYLRRRPSTEPALLLAVLLGCAGTLAYATTFLFPRLPRLVAEIHFRWQPGPDAWFAIQLLLALLVMLPATLALGGIFPAVLQCYAGRQDRVSGPVGVVYASNTVGTVLGAAAAGFLLVPALGAQRTVIAVAVLETVLALFVVLFVVKQGSRTRKILAPVLIAVVTLAALVQPRWDTMAMNAGVYMNLHDSDPAAGWDGFIRDLRENHVVVYEEEGLTTHVFVADQPRYGNRYLSVNGKIDASTDADLETQLMLGHMPLLLHEDPRDVMVIGLASGISLGAVATHPVETIRVVELEPAMLRAARFFEDANQGVLDDKRLAFSFNDARNELEFNSATYDVIISEPSNPWMTVAANLFTEEFFELARRRVRDDGIFCQWVQNYYLDIDDLRSIVGAFHASFPNVMVFETIEGVDLMLMGSAEPLRLDLDRFGSRMAELRVNMDLQRVGVRQPVDTLNLFRMGTSGVERLIQGADRNTDDNARVEFAAPRKFGADTLGPNRARIHALSTDPLDEVDPPIDDAEMLARHRLRLAQNWLWRGDHDLAARAAHEILDGPHRAAAEEILAKIDSVKGRP